jgi:glycerol-3-phosphate cytidylyltransferase
MQAIKRVYIPGVWDLFHVGHLNVLREAKKFGTHLIVGICCDEIVKLTKKDPPIVLDKWRREVLDSISIVDSTVIYRDLDYFKMVEFLGAEVFAVGEEFGYLPEHRIALRKFEEAGIEVHFLPRLGGISTTELKEKILTLNQQL